MLGLVISAIWDWCTDVTCLVLHLVNHGADYSHTSLVCAVLEQQAFHGRFYVNFWPLKNCGQERESTWSLSLAEAMNNLFTVSDSQSEASGEISSSLSEPASVLPACWEMLVQVDWGLEEEETDCVCVCAEKSREQPCMMLAFWRHGTVAVHSSNCPSSRKIRENN